MPSKILEYLSLNILIKYFPTNICVLYKIMGPIGFEVTVCPLADYVGMLSGSTTQPPIRAVVSSVVHWLSTKFVCIPQGLL